MIISRDLFILGDEYFSFTSKSRSGNIRNNCSSFSQSFDMKTEEEAMVHILDQSRAHRLNSHDNSPHHFNSHQNHNQNQRAIELVFQNISVSIESKPKSSNAKLPQERRILNDITGYAKPGQVLAVMGPSGSGKTTLLSTLSGRLKPTYGCITLNGETINKQLRRKICYVLQQDIFFPSLTLRQTLSYTAQLRLPDWMSYTEKTSHVQTIIDVLDLRHCQDTIIGDMMKRGLSGGEKKRANIACELITNPNILLIDEPTSGLDSSTAHSLMQTLKDYAVKEKKTIVATIHQPSSQMFYMFDKLLLLCCGRLAYFGDVRKVVPFFDSIGLEISAHYNPADFVMEKVKNTSLQEKIINAAKALSKCPEEKDDNILNQSSYREDTLCDTSSPILTTESQEIIDNHSNLKDIELQVIIDEQKELNRVYDKIVCDDDSGRSSWSQTDRSSTSTFSSNCSYSDEVCVNVWSQTSDQKWPTSFWTQLKVLTKRNFFEARNRMLSKLNWIQTIALAVVAGLIWFQVVRTEDTLNDIRGWMFFTTTYWMLFALFGALISFPSEKEVINKERSSGAYRLSSYYLAKMIGELPLTITLPSVFFIISYPMMGYSNTSTFLSLWAFLILSTICAQSVGLFIGAACDDLEVSVTLSALYSLSTMLFAGYYSAKMPHWLSWLRYCSMVYYAFLNMQIVEFFNGPHIECSLQISRFSSCKLNNLSHTFGDTIPQTIPFSELSLHLDTMNEGYEPFPIWFNTIVLIIFLLTFRLMGYFVLRYLRKPK